MTVEEAIKILEVNVICSPKATDFKEAVETIKKALEKQIPKKVIPFCNSGIAMACPECGTFQDFVDKEVLNNRSECCYKCGQTLDWSDSE